jgi:surface antigen
MRPTSAVLASVLVATVALSGCGRAVETVRQHPEATIGAGAGIAGGALIGGLITQRPTGAIVGGLLGGLAGGAAGEYMARRDRTHTEAATALNYSPAQGSVVRIEEAHAVPQTAQRGQTVNLAAIYTVLTPQQEPITVRETRVVRHNGQVVANPAAEFQRAPGTYTSALPITLPADAPPGQYEVTTTVVAGGQSSTANTTFTVN